MRDVLQDRVFLTFMGLTSSSRSSSCSTCRRLPVQMADDGLSPAQYGVVISLNAVLIVLATVPITRWVERFPTARSLVLGRPRCSWRSGSASDGVGEHHDGGRPHGDRLDDRRA